MSEICLFASKRSIRADRAAGGTCLASRMPLYPPNPWLSVIELTFDEELRHRSLPTGEL